ncbi:ead/Ea22-like family protein [Pseudomonas aeruginosa]
MTDHAELRRLSEVATPGEWRTGDGDDSLPDCVLSGEFVVCEHAGGDVDYIAAANPKTVLALLDEIDGLNDELSACTEHPGGCGYWREAAKRRAEERDRLRAQNDALRGALHAVQAEVDGNLRPLTRDLVNMVSGLKNGSHPNDIYEHCDEIERIIGAALEGDKQ